MKINYGIYPCDYCFFQRDEKNGAPVRFKGCIDYGDEKDIPHILQIKVVSATTGICVCSYTDTDIGNEFDFDIRVPCGYNYRINLTVRRKNNEEWISYVRDFRNISVGDIFVIAGQSNAVGYGRGTYCDVADVRIHNYKFGNVWSLASNPLHDSAFYDGETSRREGAYGPHITMAKKICEHTGIPVGFIPTAVGGTDMRKWNKRYIGDLYHAMTERIRDCGNDIAGIIWYQGESDTIIDERSERYYEALSQFISDTREELGKENLKFFVYQLNRSLIYPEERDASWCEVRDAQRRIAAEDENVYITASFGAQLMEDGIHNSPAGCDVLGERMASLILRELHGMNSVAANAPNAEKAEKTNEKEITVHFNSETYFAAKSSCGGAYDFKVMDSDGENSITDIISEVNKIRLVTEKTVKDDSVVYGGYGSNPKNCIPCDIVSNIPMLAFKEKLQ